MNHRTAVPSNLPAESPALAAHGIAPGRDIRCASLVQMLLAAMTAGSLVMGVPRWEAISACCLAIASAGIVLAVGARLERPAEESGLSFARWMLVAGCLLGGMSWSGVVYFGLTLGTTSQATITLLAGAGAIGLAGVAAPAGMLSCLAFAAPLSAMLMAQLAADPLRGGPFAAVLVGTVFLLALWGTSVRAASVEAAAASATQKIGMPASASALASASSTVRFTAETFGRPARLMLALSNHRSLAEAQRLLIERGHELVTAWDLATAIRLASERPFDAILLEARPADAPEVAGSLRRAASHAGSQGLVLIGVASHPADVGWCEHAGLDALITSPISAERLDPILAGALGKAGAAAAAPAGVSERTGTAATSRATTSAGARSNASAPGKAGEEELEGELLHR